MNAPLPLAGVRVADLGRTFAAPFATQMLADLGAEVIKLERKGRGDEMRYYGPPFLHGEDGKEMPISSYFIAANRGKKSIEVDYTKPGGQQMVKDLAAKCDVLVENFKVGDLARYGLDYDSICKVNPDIIYCSVTGFGQDGPYAPRPGTDGVFQALSGMMSVTGEPDGPPTKIGLVIVDLITGLYTSNAIQAALTVKNQGGPGQLIDMALLDVALATMSHRALDYLISGDIPLRTGTSTSGSAPAQAYQCADGHINIQASADEKFHVFCRLIDRLDLLEEQRFANRALRFSNVKALETEIERTLAKWKMAELHDTLVAAGIICGPIYNVAQCLDDPQVQSRGMARTVTDSSGREMPMLANPIRMSNTPIDSCTAPPQIGEHTDEVLAQVLGYNEAKIAALRAEGAI